MGQHLARRALGSDDNLTTNCWNIGPNNGPRISILNRVLRNSHGNFKKPSPLTNFVDLNLLPPELGLQILKNLNATDLCLASCVWTDLANDESLWEGLCKASWGFCGAYRYWKKDGRSFKRLFLMLDEGSLTFNTQPLRGIDYLIEHGIMEDNPEDIAMFFHSTNQLNWQKVRLYIRDRPDVLEEVIKLQSYRNQFLPNALRKFFNAVDSPTSRGEYLSMLIDKFSRRFCCDNPELQFNTVLHLICDNGNHLDRCKINVDLNCRSVTAEYSNKASNSEIVAILCYSLILLSVDLSSPHVKNKMSKREFIRNICRAIEMANHHQPNNQQPQDLVDRDFAGHLYDNVYLVGHVAPQRWDDQDNLPPTRRH